MSKHDRDPLSEKGAAMYEKHTAAAQLLAFSEEKLGDAVVAVNDSEINRDVLRKHFARLRYIRLQVFEGHRKGAETRRKNREERAGVAKAADSNRKERAVVKVSASCKRNVDHSNDDANVKAAKRKDRAVELSCKRIGALSSNSSDDDSDEIDSEHELELNCASCEKKGSAKSMMICDGTVCDVGIHITCLDASLTARPDIKWLCSKCESIPGLACHKCGSTQHKDAMLLYDGKDCSTSVHFFCLTPALPFVPNGDWFCLACEPPGCIGSHGCLPALSARSDLG